MNSTPNAALSVTRFPVRFARVAPRRRPRPMQDQHLEHALTVLDRTELSLASLPFTLARRMQADIDALRAVTALCRNDLSQALRANRRVDAPESEPDPAASIDCLSARERDVLTLVCRGLSNKRIALSLAIAPETVKAHFKRIFLKLEVGSRAQAVFRATSLGLLPDAKGG